MRRVDIEVDTSPLGLTHAHRADDGALPVRVTRTLPLHWVLTILAALIANGALLWHGQSQQAEAMKGIREQFERLTSSLTDFRVSAIEDRGHVSALQYQTSELGRRITALEDSRSVATPRR